MSLSKMNPLIRIGLAFFAFVVTAVGVGVGAGPVSRWFSAGAAASASVAENARRDDPPAVIGTCDTAGPIEIESTGGTTAPTVYATLKDSFDAINAGTHTGGINVEVCGNTTETATASLNASGSGAASYTGVTIRPVGAARIIEGSIAGAVIKLTGADNVTIDGRIGGTGTARSLTVRNNSTAAATAAIWLTSTGVGAGATNNVIRNLEIAAGALQNTGTNSTFGIILASNNTAISTSSNSDDNDNNSFIANRIVKARYGIVTRGTTTNLTSGTVVTDNIVGPTAFGPDQIGKVGIFMQADTGALVSRNTVQFVGGDFANTTGGADRVGIGIGSESWSASAPGTLTSNTYTVTKNIVHDVVEPRTFSAVGINLATTGGGSATNNLVANNFIYNIVANGTSGDQVVGLGIAGGFSDNVVFNSIALTGDMDPAGTTAAATYGNAIRIANASGATHANLNLKNNSIYLDVNSNTTTVPYFAITVNAASYAFGTGGLNNNNYYVNLSNTQLNTGGLTTSGTAPAGATLFNTLAQWKLGLTPNQDAASIQSDPLNISNTADLHISAGSPNVNSGVAISGVVDDIDGQLRVAAPDIGADEPGGVTPPANDISATAIVTPASGSTRGSGLPFVPQASFTNSGTNSQTNVTVRFKITDASTATVYNQTAVIPSIGPLQTTTVDFPSATINAAGAYATSATAELAGDQNTSNDTVGGTVNFAVPFGGTINVGAGETFTSLTNAGGFFDALNSLGAASNVTINITSDLTAESGTVALNELAAGIAVTIKPSGAARTISGSSTTNIIRINGADNVTIDGSLTGGTATGVGGNAALRNLTIVNTSATATGGAVVAVTSGGNSANNVTIRNVNISGQDPTQTLVGLHIGGNTIGAAPTGASNNNVVVDNCSFQKSILGLFNDGASAAIPATGNVVSRNDMSATGANRLRRAGIFLFNHNGIQVTENKIGGIIADEAADAIGIIAGIQNVNTTANVSGGIYNSTISRNKIDVVTSTNTTGFSAAGIAVAGDPLGPNTITNNMITGVSAPATSPDIVAGIFVAGVPSSTTRIYGNSVSNTGARGTIASQIGSYGIAISGTDPTVELKNNIFYTTQTSAGGATAKSYAIGTASTTFVNLDSNYNDFVSTGAQAGGFRTGSLDTTGTDLANLAAWQTAVSDDANSAAVDPLFVSDVSDLHIQSTTPNTVQNAGTPLAALTVDFDNQPRSATTPDIGADEVDFIAPDTLIQTFPASPSQSNTATFTFSGTDAAIATVVGFECKLDVGAFAACTSPQTYTGLSQGSHNFQVRAVDGGGNVDPTPATYSWLVDAIPPDTTILTTPSNPSSSSNATFTFGGSDTVAQGIGLAFQCKLDAASFATCTSPQTYSGLADGSHTFTVRAVDVAGNVDPTPASYSWNIVSSPVTVTATAGTATGAYNTLTDAIAAVNAGTHQGDIVVNVNQSVTEPGSVVLNSTGAGSALYTSLLIRPTGDAITVAGPTVTGRGLIELNGSDNVTIDGDNPNSAGTNRNLTLQNTAANTVTFTSVVRVALATTIVTSADNVAIRNLNIVGSSTGRNISTATSTTASENTTFGVLATGGASTVAATTAPSAITSVSTTIAAGATANNLTISNNNIVTAARGVSVNGAATTVFPGLVISGNTIGNPTAGAADQVTAVGITAQGAANGLITGNTVWVEGWVASSAANTGIAVGVISTAATFTIEKNKVNRVKDNNVTSFNAYGINLGGGNNHIVQNNFVSGAINDQTAGTGAFSVTFGAFGIRVGSGTGHKVYNNSVNLYGAMTGVVGTNLTAAFGLTSTTVTGVDVRNNLFSNQITGGNPTGTRNVAIFLQSGATSALNLTLNNNGYYAGIDALNRLGQVGTTFGTGEFLVTAFDPTQTTPAGNLRSYTSTLSAAATNDNVSFAAGGAAPVTSNSDLHIPASTPTRLESGGAAVGLTSDIDNESRNATTPDIGADEFAGLPPAANDMAAFAVVTPANGATLQTGATFVPQASFTNNGTAPQSNVTVRFRITDSTNAVIYNQTATIASITPSQVVTVSFPSTSVTPVGTFGTQANSELAGDTITTNDSVSGTFTTVAPLSGTISVGTGQTYTSLTNAGGVFQALNTAGISGNTTINITSDLTAETGAVLLNQLQESGAGGYTLTIKPSGAARVISGTSAASAALITLNGADRVVIDGSLSGGTDRSLTITNNQLTTGVVIWMRSPTASNGATNNTVKNCVINGGPGPNSTTVAGILTGSGTTLGSDAEAPNSNNTIQNNWIYRVQNSLFIRGGTAQANFDQNWVISGNELGSSVGNDKNIFRGMLIGNAQNFLISGNFVHGVQSTTTTTAAMSGIQVAVQVNGGFVLNNTISDIKNVSTTGTGAFGINIGTTSLASNVTIANNFVSDVATTGIATAGSNGFGIGFNSTATTSGYNLYFNSVNMNTNQASATTSGAMFVAAAITTAGAIDLRNNNFANTQTTGTRYGVYSLAPATVFSSINYNNYFAQNVGFIGAAARTTLLDWQTATTQDANSQAVDPQFVSATDLHIQPTSTLIDGGVAGTGITTDIDGQTRTTVPDIGADEVIVAGNPGTLAFSAATYSVGEGGGSATLTVTRTGGSVGAVGAQFAALGGTATGGATCGAGVDYVNTGGSVSFANGETSKTITVAVCADTVTESNETFNVQLLSPTGGATLGTPNPATVLINDASGSTGDFDGDGKADLAILRTVTGSTSLWSIRESNGGAIRGYQWGLENDIATPADFDGDGKMDVAVWRAGAPTVAAFYILNSSNQTVRTELFGQTGDNPVVVADYDGDGKADPAVYRPGAQAFFYYRGSLNNPSGSVTFVPWGTTGDRPAVGDFDGNGKGDFAVNRGGQWWILRDNGTSSVTTYGTGTDKLVPADYDGDGKTDIAVFRPSDTNWYILKSTTGTSVQQQWGLASDILVPGDYDGDGKTDIAVYRGGTWFIVSSLTGGFTIDYFGNATDYPVANAKVTQ